MKLSKRNFDRGKKSVKAVLDDYNHYLKENQVRSDYPNVILSRWINLI
jgi:hypothetical protein